MTKLKDHERRQLAESIESIVARRSVYLKGKAVDMEYQVQFDKTIFKEPLWISS